MRADLTLSLLVASLCTLAVTSPGAAAQMPKAPPGEAASSGIAPPGVPKPTAEEAATIAEVMAFEAQCDAAAVNGDIAFLEDALAATFIMTHGSGWTTGGMPLKVDTKDTWLDYVAKRPAPYIYRTLGPVQVELHGDVAITVGRYRYLPNSAKPNPARQGTHLFVWFERVYVKRDGKWQYLSHRTVNGPNRASDDKEPEQ